MHRFYPKATRRMQMREADPPGRLPRRPDRRPASPRTGPPDRRPLRRARVRPAGSGVCPQTAPLAISLPGSGFWRVQARKLRTSCVTTDLRRCLYFYKSRTIEIEGVKTSTDQLIRPAETPETRQAAPTELEDSLQLF